jgi:hypothetical protein
MFPIVVVVTKLQHPLIWTASILKNEVSLIEEKVHFLNMRS